MIEIMPPKPYPLQPFTPLARLRKRGWGRGRKEANAHAAVVKIQWTLGFLAGDAAHRVGINHGRAHVAVAQQLLNRAEVLLPSTAALSCWTGGGGASASSSRRAGLAAMAGGTGDPVGDSTTRKQFGVPSATI